MIISEFRNLPSNHFYSRCIYLVARMISEYARTNNLKVLIGLNSSRDEKKFERQDELDFLKNRLKNFILTIIILIKMQN